MVIPWIRLAQPRVLLKELGAVAALLAAYAVAFVLAVPFVGAAASVLSMAAVGTAGATLGTRAALVAALVSFPLTETLWAVEGIAPGEAILRVGTNGLGAIAVLLVGIALGRMRDLTSAVRTSERSVQRERTVSTQAVDALRGTEQRLDAVLRTLPVLLVATNLDGEIWLTEGRALRTLGFKHGAFDGWSVFEDFGGAIDVAAIRRALSGVESTVTITIGTRVMPMRFVPLRDGAGAIVGLVGVASSARMELEGRGAVHQG